MLFGVHQISREINTTIRRTLNAAGDREIDIEITICVV